MTDYERFLARLTPDQRRQWDDAITRITPKYLELLAREDEPCCRPENCPNSPQWNGKQIIGWGGNPSELHRCCICAEEGTDQ